MNFIKRMLISFLNKEIEAIKEDYLNSSLSVKIRERDHNKEVEKQATQRSIMIDEIGQKVIYCSNEWEDPLFGTIVGVTELESHCQQMYIVENALTKTHHRCFYRTLLTADERMVDAVLKLNPFERWNMGFKNYLRSNLWSKSYPPHSEITDPHILKQMLKEVHFI